MDAQFSFYDQLNHFLFFATLMEMLRIQIKKNEKKRNGGKKKGLESDITQQ